MLSLILGLGTANRKKSGVFEEVGSFYYYLILLLLERDHNALGMRYTSGVVKG